MRKKQKTKLKIIGALIFCGFIGGIYNQRPDKHLEEIQVGKALGPNAREYYLQEKGIVAGEPRFWGTWYLVLSNDKHIVTKKELVLRLGTTQHRVDFTVKTETEPDGSGQPM